MQQKTTWTQWSKPLNDFNPSSVCFQLIPYLAAFAAEEYWPPPAPAVPNPVPTPPATPDSEREERICVWLHNTESVKWRAKPIYLFIHLLRFICGRSWRHQVQEVNPDLSLTSDTFQLLQGEPKARPERTYPSSSGWLGLLCFCPLHVSFLSCHAPLSSSVSQPHPLQLSQPHALHLMLALFKSSCFKASCQIIKSSWL